MKIGNFEISEKSKVFIIAELSANHNGSLETAIKSSKKSRGRLHKIPDIYSRYYNY
jgi:pseudaminic acid synthase